MVNELKTANRMHCSMMISTPCLSFSSSIPVIRKSTSDRFHVPLPSSSQNPRKRCVCLANKRPSPNPNEPKKRIRSTPVSKPSLEIIREDAAAFALFLRSFYRKRSSVDNSTVNTTDDNEDDQNLLSNQDKERRPRSAFGTAVANQYVSMRGALGRIAETITIRATDFSRILFRSGTLISKALKSATPGRWKPLSAFEWQLLSPQDSKSVEQRRLQRLQDVSKSFRTGTVNLAFRAGEGAFTAFNGVFRVSALAVSAIGKTLKSVKESPMSVPSVSAATIKDVTTITSGKSSAQNSPVRKKRRYYHSGEKRSRDSRKRSPSATKAETSNLNVEVNPELPKAAPITGKKSLSITKKTIKSKEDRLNEHLKQTEDSEEEVNLREMDSKQSVLDSNPSSKGSKNSRPIPAIVLGTGAIVSIASGVSLPIFLTGSAVLLTSYAVNQAKRSTLDSEIGAKARRLFRQSEAVKGFENIIEDSVTTSKLQTNRMAYQRSLKAGTNEINRSWSGKLDDNSEMIPVIDTSAQMVSSQQQTIFSTPVVGDVLSLMDSTALIVENILRTIRRRCGMRSVGRKTVDGWVLLDSFDENLER